MGKEAGPGGRWGLWRGELHFGWGLVDASRQGSTVPRPPTVTLAAFHYFLQESPVAAG